MDLILRDLRVGFRALIKQPSSTVISILAFGLGIGLCATMFSIIYGVYFRGLDVPDSNRLAVVNRTNRSQGIDRMSVHQHDFYDWRDQQSSFFGLAGYTTGTMNLSDAGEPERFDGAFVSANIFDVLRVTPVIGTTFREGDDFAGAPLTVLLGFDVWTRRYEADPNVIGRVVKVNGEQATVIGVLPEGFYFPAEEELWIPRRDERAENARGDGPYMQVIGRLNDGVTWEEADVDMSLIAARLAEAYPETNEGVGVILNTFIEMSIGDDALPIIAAMQMSTIFVLLIACANVANLLLARATLRTKEAAVRTAMGASRFRVMLPFFTEATLMAVAGALVGIVIAFISLDLINAATTGVGKPYFMVLAVDPPILAFVVAVTILTALVSGAAPAYQIGRTDVNAILKDEGRGSSSFRASKISKIFVVGEIAMSCALLVGAGLMTKSVANLKNYEFNFATDNVFTARVGLFESDFPTREHRQAFFTDLQQTLRTIPTVRAAALTNSLPGLGSGTTRFGIEGNSYVNDQDYPIARAVVASPDIFSAYDSEILLGRDFSVDDDADAPQVAIVNQPFVDRFFPGENPIGRRFKPGASTSHAEWKTIIGVVPDLRMESFESTADIPHGYYVPLAQSDQRFMSIVLFTAGGNPLALTPEVRSAVRSVHPDTPIYWVRDMPEVIRQGTWLFNLLGGLFITFGVAALFLASVGLYGVLAFSVSRRVQELGIRLALGANTRDVIRLVIREGSLQMAIGLVLGIGLALATSNVLASNIFDVTPRDPFVFGTVVTVIVVVSLVASFVPAKRATRVDPMEALRYE